MSQVDSSNNENDSKTDKSASVLEMDHKSNSKVGIDLIETILGEMKSEFNREVHTIDTSKNDQDKDNHASTELTNGKSLTLKNESEECGTGEQSQTEVKLDSQNQNSDVTSAAVGNMKEKESEVASSAEVPSESSKSDGLSGGADDDDDDGDDAKPRIVITLKTGEDSNDWTKKTRAKSTQDSESNSEDVWTSANQELGGETGGDTCAISASGLLSGKRSLRSQAAAAAKASIEEPAGVKRSARRRSKDSPRESVLQSAIARKEKSFSNLGQGEDKLSVARNLKVLAHRSPRLSPIERNQSAGTTRTSKSPARAPLTPKSPRLNQQSSHNDQNSAKSVKSEDGAGTAAEPITKSSSAGNKSAHSTTTKALPAVKTAVKAQNHVHSTNAPTYTKTGKRRYRPYKGLRYSFTGNNIRRTKPPRRQVKELVNTSNVDATENKSSEPEKQNDVVVLPEEQAAVIVPAQQEQLECADPIAKSHAAEFPSVDLGGEFSFCSINITVDVT